MQKQPQPQWPHEQKGFSSIKLLYLTTVALIVSNIVTLILALLFAQALKGNVDNTIKLQKAGAWATVEVLTCAATRSGCDTGCRSYSTKSSDLAQCYGVCSSAYYECATKKI